MRARLILTLVVAAFITFALGGRPIAADGPYSKIAEIPIGGAGAFDYLTIDSAGHRLYVTHGADVVVIGTPNNTIVGPSGDTPGVHGVPRAPGGRGFTQRGRQ